MTGCNELGRMSYDAGTGQGPLLCPLTLAPVMINQALAVFILSTTVPFSTTVLSLTSCPWDGSCARKDRVWQICDCLYSKCAYG